MNKKNIDPIHDLEMREVIQKLKDNGYENLVDCLLDNEKVVYTKKGRLNKSSTCREMGWKGKQLEDALKNMKIILSKEFSIE